MVSKKCPIIGVHVIIFVTLVITIATLGPAKNTLNLLEVLKFKKRQGEALFLLPNFDRQGKIRGSAKTSVHRVQSHLNFSKS